MTRVWRLSLDHYLVLPLGGVLAVVWANTFGVTYFQVAGGLAFVVNDVGMAFVLAYVAQEVIEAILPGGSLHPWRRTLVPVLAAVGGVLGAVAVYVWFIRSGDELTLSQGWPIVCAVDILFSVAMARVIFGHSVAATFLVLLAIASDAVGLTVISQTHMVAEVHPVAAILIVPAIGAAAVLRRSGVHSLWPCLLLSGPLMWLGCYWAGVHPALSLLPIVPFLPHAPRELKVLGGDVPGSHRMTSHFEYVFAYPVQLVAFLFGLVNAGVLVRGFGTGTWAVLTASLVGRPVGILAAIGIAAAARLPVPRQIGWRDLLIIALAASPSLAFGLFFATAVFPTGPLLTQTKMGAIFTAAGALLALAGARLLGVGRFAKLATLRHGIHAPLTRGHV